MLFRSLKPSKLWYAIATLVGSTVGVGFYGIPFAFQKASFGVAFLFLIGVGCLVLLTNLLYGEIILRTHTRHQFVGYIHKYLGPWARRINTFNFWIAVYGALVGIVIISTQFLANIIGGFGVIPTYASPALLGLLFVGVTTVLVLAGLRAIAEIDLVMMGVFSILIGLIAFFGLGHMHVSSFQFHINSYWFLPFGVILFAINGIQGVPLLREILVGKEEKVRKAIVIGTLIPLVFFTVFTMIVLSISGDMTSPDAISGLRMFLGPKIVLIGSMFGFLTSLTIFLNLATALRESFYQDFGLKGRWTILLVTVAPYVLFFLGIRNFINIIGLVGGVAVSIDTILLIFVYVQARKRGERIPEYSIRLPNALLYIMMALFALGAVYTVFIK